MALGDPYATPSELEDRTGRADDGSYTGLLDAASRQVELFTGRQFNRTDTATERRFRALDPERLSVDDFHTLTGLIVSVDDVVRTITTDFEPRPFDGVVNGQTGWPYFDLIAVGQWWPASRRRATVEVTARWGWAAVPTGIVEATLRAAKTMVDYFATSTLAASYVSGESIGGYSINYKLPDFATMPNVPPELATAVPYRRKRFGVA